MAVAPLLGQRRGIQDAKSADDWADDCFGRYGGRGTGHCGRLAARRACGSTAGISLCFSGADQAPAESGSECGDSECRPSPTRFSSEQGGGEPQCDAANGGSGDPVRCVATTHELVGIDPTRSDF